MSSIAWLAAVLGVPKIVASTLVVGVAAIMALPVSNKEHDESCTISDKTRGTVKLEMDPWERVKLAEALREARR